MSSKRGRGGTTGAKFRMTLGLPVAAVINCAGACLAAVVVRLMDCSIGRCMDGWVDGLRAAGNWWLAVGVG